MSTVGDSTVINQLVGKVWQTVLDRDRLPASISGITGSEIADRRAARAADAIRAGRVMEVGVPDGPARKELLDHSVDNIPITYKALGVLLFRPTRRVSARLAATDLIGR